MTARKRSYTPISRDHHEVAAAGAAVAQAKRRGILPAATDCCCVWGDHAASEFHHISYAPGEWLNIIPTCKTHHQRHHRCGLPLPPLGIVVLSIGVVRIAIAP